MEREKEYLDVRKGESELGTQEDFFEIGAQGKIREEQEGEMETGDNEEEDVES